MSKFESKTLKISYSNIEDAVASFLIATGVVNDNEHIISVNLPMEPDKDGLVDIHIATTTLSN